MLIGQLTDPHVLAGRKKAYGAVDGSALFEAAEDHLFNFRPALDALVMTGDLADRGEREAYEFIGERLSRWKVPVRIVPGNHDDRKNMAEVLGDFLPAPDPAFFPGLGGAEELGPAKLIFLDSKIEGRHGGGLDGKALSRLGEIISGTPPEKRILLFVHHPPFASGMGMMDEEYPGLDRLVGILKTRPNLLLCAGHLHRAMAVDYPGGRAAVAPPVSLQMELELFPSGGDRFRPGAPGYALHHLENGVLNTHFGTVPPRGENPRIFSFSDPTVPGPRDPKFQNPKKHPGFF
ncbi:MAG: metallophosphoesterase [Deltaproteobacteria bacterium]|jgi:3',5'-cyclic AMP phosphodiesterase CpdA|nr:metallophosphoesterase [Deltaproteobacteria bacterium]